MDKIELQKMVQVKIVSLICILNRYINLIYNKVLDNIKAILFGVSRNYITEEFSQYINNHIDIVVRESGNKTIKGTLDNASPLVVVANVENQSISIEGSLCKFFKGNNVETLSRGEVREALDLISNKLNLCIKEAKITRLDIAENFETKYSPKNYFYVLNYKPRFIRSNVETSLYFKNKSRTLLFYDKKRKAKDLPISVLKNLFRYEYRLLNKLLYKRMILVRDLYSDEFYDYLINEYIEEFMKIDKSDIFEITPDIIKTPSDITKFLALYGIKKIGVNNCYELIEYLKRENRFVNINQYSKSRNMIKSLINEVACAKPSKKIEELEKLISSVRERRMVKTMS